MSLIDSLPHWQFWSEEHEGFRTLPDWAKFMLALGAAVARLPGSVSDSLTAVAVPTRGFCAALVTAGYLIEREQVDADKSAGKHLESLRALEIGDIVWIRRQGHAHIEEGSFEGFTRLGDQELIKVKTVGRGSFIYSTPITAPYRVQPASQNRTIRRSRRIQRQPLGAFAAAAFAPLATLDAIEARGRLDVRVIGQKNLIEDEITQSRFAIASGDGDNEGFLQDIIRAIGVQTHSPGQGFATLLESPYSDHADADPPGAAQLSVLDGDKALRRSRDAQGHWVVILERASRGFDDSCYQIDQLYFERAAEMPKGFLPWIPSGIEVSTFVRRVIG